MSTAKKHHTVHKEKAEPKQEAAAPEEKAPQPKTSATREVWKEIGPATEGFNKAAIHVADCVRNVFDRVKANGASLDDIDSMVRLSAHFEELLPAINALCPKKEKSS